MFKIAWETVFIMDNICSAFAATNIHLLQPTKILDQLKPKTPLQPVESKFETPNSVRTVCQFIKTVTANQTELNTQFDTAMRALEKMSIEKKILAHENAGFFKALIKEKKRRRRSKNMELFPKNKLNQVMFFFPNKINAAQSQQQFLNTQKEQEKLEKKLKAEARVEEKE